MDPKLSHMTKAKLIPSPSPALRCISSDSTTSNPPCSVINVDTTDLTTESDDVEGMVTYFSIHFYSVHILSDPLVSIFYQKITLKLQYSLLAEIIIRI